MAFVALVSMLIFLTAQTFWLSSLALFMVGLSTSGWYPLAKAQAYARGPVTRA
jgi:NADH:ubiquinone oxidoreductase subunit 6 (subunit J)